MISEYAATVRLLGLRLSEEQHRACVYLERHGQRFCVDYGYDNAVEKARDHWRKRRAAARKRQRHASRS